MSRDLDCRAMDGSRHSWIGNGRTGQRNGKHLFDLSGQCHAIQSPRLIYAGPPPSIAQALPKLFVLRRMKERASGGGVCVCVYVLIRTSTGKWRLEQICIMGVTLEETGG